MSIRCRGVHPSAGCRSSVCREQATAAEAPRSEQEGRLPREGGDGQNGRVYRVTWAGTKDSPALPRRGMDSWAKIMTLAPLVREMGGRQEGAYRH